MLAEGLLAEGLGTDAPPIADEAATQDEVHEEVDLDEALEREAAANPKRVVTKKREEPELGDDEAMPPPRGVKRSRDAILAELKASRAAAAAAQREKEALGPRFRKVGTSTATTTGSATGSAKRRIERDERGREVLITVDEEGRVKRKVRRAVGEMEKGKKAGLLMPEEGATVLGMDVEKLVGDAQQRGEKEEDEEMDIFEGVGGDYDPLAALEEGEESASTSSSASKEEEEEEEDNEHARPQQKQREPPTRKPSTTGPSQHTDEIRPSGPKRDYFHARSSMSEAQSEHQLADAHHPPVVDETMLAALKKAAQLVPRTGSGGAGEELAGELRRQREKERRHREMLSGVDRDAEDIDLGFGGSRGEDLRDGEEENIGAKKGGKGRGKGTLSVWGDDNKAKDKGKEKHKQRGKQKG